ncbi:MAG TPA: aminotransferase class V-fold PLP-dependent enzyme [Phycisphaerales bacterium]|nr:aminotransferase class V-fold PLP-dependent enzyme [Phycisphaerales bacterium]
MAHGTQTLDSPPPGVSFGPEIADAVRALGDGPLTEDGLRRHVHPLFSRVLRRGEIYLSNHSLGRPLDRTADDIRHALDLWYDRLDGAWPHWIEASNRYRAMLAALIGCSRPDAVVPRVSAGQGLRAALNSLPTHAPRIVTTRGEFDSVDFILKTYQRKGRADLCWVAPDDRGLFSADAIIDAIDADTDLVVVSVVYFVTGQVLDGLDRIIKRAHDAGSLVLLDAYHAAGAIPVQFDRLAPDFAIGGNYKYTRGGPGAGWLAIHPRHLEQGPLPALFSTDTGWFAKRDTFAFRRPDQPELGPGGDAWLEATPAVLTCFQALAGLELTLALGVERLRGYNLEQQAFLEDELARAGVPVLDVEPHGAFLLVPTPQHAEMTRRLHEAGVNTDSRPAPHDPSAGYVRLCPDILNSFDELRRTATIIGGVYGQL